jgi:hypothetical protein
MKIYINGIYDSKENIELRTALLDAERTKSPVKFYTRNRNYINTYKCIDTDNKPFILERFTTHGGLVYYKVNSFEWKNISIDSIAKIEIL